MRTAESHQVSLEVDIEPLWHATQNTEVRRARSPGDAPLWRREVCRHGFVEQTTKHMNSRSNEGLAG
jgi:hypothetical protein